MATKSTKAPEASLYLDSKRLAAVKRKISQDPKCRKGWQAILRQAGGYLREIGAIEPGKAGEMRSKGLALPYNEMLMFLGFAWRIGREPKHAEGARRVLDVMAGLELWESVWTDRVPNWHASLAAGSTTSAYGTCLSWLADALSDEERRRYASALVEKGIKPLLGDWLLPGSRIHALDSMGHNFWAHSIHGAGIGAIAVRGLYHEAEDWMVEVKRALEEWCDYPGNVLQNKVANFGADGGYYESLSYAGCVGSYFRFADAYRLATGDSSLLAKEQFRSMPDYFLSTVYQGNSGLWGVNFGDHVSSDWSTKANVGEYPMILFLAARFRNPQLQRLAQLMRPFPDDPVSLLWYDEKLPAGSWEKLPKSKVFHDLGWGMARDGWAKGHTLFAIKSGMTWNHTHADAGSFILWSGGEQLLLDSGSVNYPRKEYVPYYCQSLAHNVVLWENRGQPTEDIYRGTKNRGSIPVFLDAGNYRYILADATGPNASIYQRFFRHVIIWDGSYVIVDDLLAHAPGAFAWLFHPGGEVGSEANQFTIQRGSSRLRLTVAHPSSFTTEVREGFLEKDRSFSAEIAPDPTRYYALVSRPAEESRTRGELAFGIAGVQRDFKITGREEKFIVVLTPYRDGREEELPRVSAIRGDGVKGVSLVKGDREARIYLNLLADGRIMHHNSYNSFEGITTDATLTVAVLVKGKPAGYRLHNGSFLRVEGRSLFESWLKSELVLDLEGKGSRARLLSRPRTSVALSCQRKPRSFSINGTATRTFDYDPRLKLVRFLTRDNDNVISVEA